MTQPEDITTHYSRGDLLQRLNAALADDGADPAQPSLQDLAPFDQFHGRGIEATAELAALVQAGPYDRLLGLHDRTYFHVGDALAIPLAEARFDGADSMNVSMNIADKAAFYRQIARVLKPGAWLVLWAVARGHGEQRARAG